jgi:multidrug efflux pump subunit AcrA (membrane-fusion protein)
MDTEVDIANPDLKLVPGMYAEVNLKLAERNQVVSVPLDGVETANGVSQVFLVDGQNILRRKTVVTGLETAQRIEVSSGLNTGDVVVVGRRAGLRDGQHVKTKLSEVT